MAIIYLDQMAWVALSKANKGIEPEYTCYKNVLKKMIETSSNSKHIYPLSYSNLIEAHKRTKLTSRQELLELMFKISKFKTITFPDSIASLEVKNAILQFIGKPVIDMQRIVIGNELGWSMGYKGVLIRKNGGEVSQRDRDIIEQALKDPQYMARALSQDKGLKVIEKLKETESETLKNTIILRDSSPAYNNPSKIKRKCIANAQFFLNSLMGLFLQETDKLGLDNKELSMKIFVDRKTAEQFAVTTNSLFVKNKLSNIVLANKSKN
jgi:hypothetical protein